MVTLSDAVDDAVRDFAVVDPALVFEADLSGAVLDLLFAVLLSVELLCGAPFELVAVSCAIATTAENMSGEKAHANIRAHGAPHNAEDLPLIPTIVVT